MSAYGLGIPLRSTEKVALSGALYTLLIGTADDSASTWWHLHSFAQLPSCTALYIRCAHSCSFLSL